MIDPYHCNHSTTKQASNVKLRLHGYGCVLHWSPGERCAQDNALRARQERESSCEHDEGGQLHDDSWTIGVRTRRRYQAPMGFAPAYSCWPAVELLADDLGGLEIVDLAECLSIGELLGNYWADLSDCPISDVLERHEGPLALALGGLSEEQAEELAEELAEEEPGSDAIVALLRSIVIVARLSVLRDDLDLEPLEEWFDEWIWSGDIQVLDVLAEDWKTAELLRDVASVLELPLKQEIPDCAIPSEFQDTWEGPFSLLGGTLGVGGEALDIPLSENAKRLLFGENGRPDIHDNTWYGAAQLTWGNVLQDVEIWREIADLDDLQSSEARALNVLQDVPKIVSSGLELDAKILLEYERIGAYHFILRDVLVTKEQLLSYLLYQELFEYSEVEAWPGSYGSGLEIANHEAQGIQEGFERLHLDITIEEVSDSNKLLGALARVLRLVRDQELPHNAVDGDLGSWLHDLADELEEGGDDD